jgi:hypothetical protein
MSLVKRFKLAQPWERNSIVEEALGLPENSVQVAQTVLTREGEKLVVNITITDQKPSPFSRLFNKLFGNLWPIAKGVELKALSLGISLIQSTWLFPGTGKRCVLDVLRDTFGYTVALSLLLGLEVVNSLCGIITAYRSTAGLEQSLRAWAA